MSHRLTFLLSLGLFLAAQSACMAMRPQEHDYLLEVLEAPAPSAPALCDDAARQPGIEAPRAILYVFTSEWCTACDRLLARLEELHQALQERDVAVHHLVTGMGDSCMGAARVARRSNFAYGAAPRHVEESWRVRSTPTLWLVGPAGTALVYVEGIPPSPELIEAIDIAMK